MDADVDRTRPLLLFFRCFSRNAPSLPDGVSGGAVRLSGVASGPLDRVCGLDRAVDVGRRPTRDLAERFAGRRLRLADLPERELGELLAVDVPFVDVCHVCRSRS
ncbi:hypothetical protein [Halorubrum sp. BV1]|uniref:hypothetical protein n=1 Tax=Halorubrum sp. BV1 TaxID=1498500 RepID=UPI000678757B|nr:hypothetical protein [Halorubrum sp. BV1]